MQKKIILPNKKDLSEYEKYGLNTFLLPLEDYSIGCNVYYNIDEINELSKRYEVIVYMNKLLHKKIDEFKEIYSSFNSNIKFMCEDIGLSQVISKDRFIMYENHIVSNYKAINFLNTININDITINNDLTINEIEEIIEKTNCNLYYFYISKNILMYSRRNLVSNYNKHYNLESTNNYNLEEKVTKMHLTIDEENDGSIIRFNKIFCASKYLDKLDSLNLVIDLTNIDELNEKMILENIDNSNLCNLIDSDYYFLENDIKYKVGDLK